MRPFKNLLASVAISLSLWSSLGHAITIDEFEVDSILSSSVVGDVVESQVDSTRAIGGRRQLAVSKTTAAVTGAARLETATEVVGTSTGRVLGFTLGNHGGFGRVTWDGDNSPNTLTANGLGSIDITEDGGTAFETGLLFFDYPFSKSAMITLRLYDSTVLDGSKYSDVEVVINQAWPGPEVHPLSIPFSLFTAAGDSAIPAPGGATFKTTTTFGPGGGVDITKVGAIELTLAGYAADLTVTRLATNGKCTWFPKKNGDVTDRCGVCLTGDASYNYEANKAFDGCGLCPSEAHYLLPAGTRDDCGVCLSGEPGYSYEDPKDSCGLCPSAPNFGRAKDPCGVCFGDGSSCADCSGVPNGSAQIDQCGVCAGDGTSCLDCAGVPNGTAGFDQCNVCNGDGKSCLDCAGTPFGNKKIDACGECGGLVTDAKNCPQPVQCVMVQATSKVKKFERGLTKKGKTLRARFLDEKKRSERMKCAINTAPSEALVSDAYAHIAARSKEIFSKGVEVCGDSCVTVSYAEDVENLLPYFKVIEKEAKFLARRVKKCYSRLGVIRTAGGTNGLAQTVGTVNKDLKGLIAECRKQKACPPAK